MNASARGKQKKPTPAAVFAALGDETRLRLVSTLAGGEPRSIAELTRESQISRQGITKHLRVLQGAGLVRSVVQGRENRFELEPKPLAEMRSYLDRIATQWEDALGRLKAFVET